MDLSANLTKAFSFLAINPSLSNINAAIMKNKGMKFVTVASFASLVLLTSCDKEKNATSTETVGADSSKEASSSRKKVPGIKEIMQLGKDLQAYKEKVNYQEPAEVETLGAEIYKDLMQINKLKEEHPTIKKIDEEGAEANEKLMQAVRDKDEEAKQKWGRIVGNQMMKKREAATQIPEIVALQTEMAAKTEKMHQIEYEALSKDAEGKKLAARLKEVNDATKE